MKKAAKKGRPLSFDREAALQKAMLLFWRYGYEATSLHDLTTVMGVTPPSIYTAFGDKKRLFLEAVNHYLSGPTTPWRIIDEAGTAKEAAVRLLTTAAIGFTGENTPPGCLLASAALSCSAEAADVQQHLADIRRDIEAHLRDRISQDIEKGEMAAETDADALAGLTMTVLQGMSTLARDGATRDKLMRVTAQAIFCWPHDNRPAPQRQAARKRGRCS